MQCSDDFPWMAWCMGYAASCMAEYNMDVTFEHFFVKKIEQCDGADEDL